MPKNDFYMDEIIAEPNGPDYEVQQPASAWPYEVRSEEVQDIMSKMPHWIVRRGTAVLFMAIALLFTGACYIHYPDIIITQVTILSSDPPVKVISQTGGKIQRLFIKNNQAVAPGENICLIENTANYDDVIAIKKLLARLDTAMQVRQMVKDAVFNEHVQLGELQAGYAELYQAVHQYNFFIERNFVNHKLGQLQSQMQYQDELNHELESRDMLLRQQLMLEKKKFMADSSLLKEKVIAPLEFDNSRKELINKQMTVDATKTSILQNKLQRSEYFKTLTDLQQQNLQQENDLQQQIRENVKRLLAQLEDWEHKYVIKSPVQGKAVFFKIWTENQYITSGEPVLMIVPPAQNFIAKAFLPVNGAGKVKPGQKVLIKLSAYPFDEFGMIRGKVAAVSTVALDTAYAVEIRLVNGLTTTSNKQIPAHAQLTGTGEVVTSDKNILERILGKVWNRYNY